MAATKTSKSKAKPVPSSRLSALGALAMCIDKKLPLEITWDEDPNFSTLSPQDRAFAQRLVKTTIRRLGQIDDLLARFLEQPLHKQEPRMLQILRLGVAQLAWEEIPPHAAVHSSVELSKQVNLGGYSGLINAVLKRISEQWQQIVPTQDAAKLNTPEWLWKNWENTYGEEITRRIALSHLVEPPLDISIKTNAPEWAETLGGALLPEGSVRIHKPGAVSALPGYAEGAWWVQDVAASIPAMLFDDVAGKQVVDLCAAPGGKTAQLAASGANVTSVDISRNRMKLLEENLTRLKLSAKCVVADVLKWKPDEAPDAILLDAPCSATGTLRRHPDVALNKTPEDIARLVATQKKLLAHTLSMLKPGGRLVYAVCSLQPEEGEKQISALLAERKDVLLIPVQAAKFNGYTTPRGELRTLPCHKAETGGMDGFFAALLEKKG